MVQVERRYYIKWIEEIYPKHNLNLDLFDNEQLSWLFYGINANLDINKFANPKFSSQLMGVLVTLITAFPNVEKFPQILFSSKLSHKQMTTIAAIMIEGGEEFDFSLLNENQSPDEMIHTFTSWRVHRMFH